MNQPAARSSVRLYAPECRDRTIAFLREVDEKFFPPLSSPLRYGSIEGYLDYSLARGEGHVLIYERGAQVIGFVAYRRQDRAGLEPGALIYLSNMSVTHSLMGTVLLSLFQAMVRQVDAEWVGSAQRICATTWRQNFASARTLQRMGMQLVRTVERDPAFGGCRDTLVFEGTWADFVRNVQLLSRST